MLVFYEVKFSFSFFVCLNGECQYLDVLCSSIGFSVSFLGWLAPLPAVTFSVDDKVVVAPNHAVTMTAGNAGYKVAYTTNGEGTFIISFVVVCEEFFFFFHSHVI
jgi:hypothetical protein